MDYARVLFSLFAVLAMIGALALIVRKTGLAATAGASAPRRRRRLAVSESLFLDPRRRAIILQCDGEEHLVLLGPAGETVVQSHLAGPDIAALADSAPPPSFLSAWRRSARRDPGAAVSDAA